MKRHLSINPFRVLGQETAALLRIDIASAIIGVAIILMVGPSLNRYAGNAALLNSSIPDEPLITMQLDGMTAFPWGDPSNYLDTGSIKKAVPDHWLNIRYVNIPYYGGLYLDLAAIIWVPLKLVGLPLFPTAPIILRAISLLFSVLTLIAIYNFGKRYAAGERCSVGRDIGEIIGRLLGCHYVLVDTARYVTGNFNKHMQYAILLQVDEGFWAVDKAAEGRLKGLITSRQHQIELKGIDLFTVTNYIRAIITSNNEWVVPAGFKARRWIVVDVNERHINDKAYFQAIRDEDPAALLHNLLNFDLSKVDFSKIPQTEALLDQKIASFSAEQSWWFDLLQAGILPAVVNQRDDKDELKLDTNGKPIPIPNSCYTSELYERYIVHAKTRGFSHRSIETRMGMFLQKIVRPHTIVKNRLGRDRVAYYVLPSLKDGHDSKSEDDPCPIGSPKKNRPKAAKWKVDICYRKG